MLIRADSSVEIGAGHVVRCGALADALYDRGIRPTLLTQDLPGGIAAATRALDVITLPVSADADVSAAEFSRAWLMRDAGPSMLIVDHYGLDATWEEEARGDRTSVLVIDDMANRPHACQLLLDQNLSRDAERRYAAQVPTGCRMLLGPEYALLRSEFAHARRGVRPRDGIVRRVLVFFGGSDPVNLTTMTIEAIARLTPRGILFDVVVGSGNPYREAIRTAAAMMPNVTYHCQTTQMAELMAHADLSIGAGGTATWERCCLGLPTLVVIAAANQRMVVDQVAVRGACVNLGDASELDVTALTAALDDALCGRVDLATMSVAAMEVTDGMGARRVADVALQA